MSIAVEPVIHCSRVAGVVTREVVGHAVVERVKIQDTDGVRVLSQHKTEHGARFNALLRRMFGWAR